MKTIEKYLDDIAEPIYGSTIRKFIRLNMAGGGSHWYNYIVFFNEDGDQDEVLKEDKDGTHELKSKNLYISNQEDRYDHVIIMSDFEFADLKYCIRSHFTELRLYE